MTTATLCLPGPLAARRHANECRRWDQYRRGLRRRPPRCSAEPRGTVPEYLLPPPVDPSGGDCWCERFNELWRYGWRPKNPGEPFYGNLYDYLAGLTCAGCGEPGHMRPWPMMRRGFMRLFGHCSGCEAWVELM